MNANTRIVLLCCQLDDELVSRHLPFHRAHQCPITVLSPSDSAVFIPGLDCRNTGKRAYIGQDAIDRLRGYLSICLEYPENFFLFHEPDSLCLNPEIPAMVYEEAERGTAWCNETVDPRPHETPYRKIAMHLPLFFTRSIIYRILTAPRIPTHPITPYGDWWLTAHCWSAGIPTRSFSPEFGSTFVHPIKTEDRLREVLETYHREKT